MRKIRYGLIALWMLMCSVTTATAQVSIGIGLPNVSIGINLSLFPELVPVPGYPVYYAPRVAGNYFFYDGMYWVYQEDYWYASSWYNGPWAIVQPEFVPVFILRVPVRYYRQPPVYFRGWRSSAPPRWGQHWGRDWEHRRRGWDRWDRGSAPRRAPLPVYQRQYSGDRYPRQVEQQHTLRSRNYRYQPRDTAVRQHFQQQGERRAPAPAQRERREEPRMKSPRQEEPRMRSPRQEEPRMRSPGPQDTERSAPPRQGGPAEQRSQPPQHTPPRERGPEIRDERQEPGAVKRKQKAPRPQEQEQGSREKGEKQEQQEEERGRGHNN